MLVTVEDSEDELGLSPLRPLNVLSQLASPLRCATGPDIEAGSAAVSTGMQLRTAAADLFNTSSGDSGLSLYSLTANKSFVATDMGKKRRKTDDTESKRLRDRMMPERSQSSGAEGSTQLARENVLLPEGTQTTIEYSAVELETMLQQAGRDDPMAHHDTVVQEQEQHNTSSSIPWSLDPPSDARMSTASAERRTSPRQHSPPLALAEATRSQNTPNNAPSAESADVPLPQEQYKPRPSRSRSAQIQESVVDLGTTPEKAAKKRKRRTMTEIEDTQRDKDGLDEELKRRAREARKDDSSADKRSSASTGTAQTATTEKISDSQAPRSGHEPQSHHSTPPDSAPTPSAPTALPTTTDHRPGKTPPPPDIQIVIPRPRPSPTFATPKAPASASKRGPKSSRRSHTTIFEDHVGLTDRPDPSPNLRQQQAVRKRGRGRPRKTRPEEMVAEGQGGVEGQGEAEEEEDLIAMAEGDRIRKEKEVAAPTQRKRGRPRKEVPVPVAAPEEGPEKENAVVARAEEEDAPAVDRAVECRPSTPEREVEPPTTVEKAARPTHSPIRKSTPGGATFRVGLSKRQRIQPLLRVCKR
ncbi:hypothetical protein K461DRAFT_324479 [Myriangium duriaei CBS 260.36]|uniref:Uncharacterized protein n=1 Tax=Myriangium duriaei CBS 260.36 TaxID=1168546 RepID=A0A9P4IS69_9PEZI|nr:hypothetical protein K461DRAFT_324479 [Myriangium duriaei CBS 260.36]